MRVVAGQWRCLWVSLTVPEDAPAGDVLVRVRLFRADTLSGQSEEELAEVVFRLHVLPASLPPQILTNSGWFHVDCLATWYRVPVFSEEHWAILGSYMRNAAPLASICCLPPCSLLLWIRRWAGSAPRHSWWTCMYRKPDIASALTSWTGIWPWRRIAVSPNLKSLTCLPSGGRATRQNMGLRDGREERLFGWETDAASPAYEAFLRAFLRALRAIWMKLAAGPLLFPSVR